METMTELAEAVSSRPKRRYEVSLKQRIMHFVAQERLSGRSWSSLSTGLGVAEQTLKKWSREQDPPRCRLLHVRTVSASTGLVSVVSPSGWKIEGLDLSQALQLVTDLVP